MPLTRETKVQFEKEESAYWSQRDDLMTQYAGRWVAIVGGKVVAVGDDMNDVAGIAYDTTRSKVMFVTQVGDEQQEFVIRQTATGTYDRRYRRAMPVIDVSVSNPEEPESIDETFVVDTGSDITLVQDSVGDRLNLWSFVAGRADISGIGSLPTRRQLFLSRILLGGQVVRVAVDCRDDISENILGRDIINRFAVSLCAKRDEVRFEWVD